MTRETASLRIPQNYLRGVLFNINKRGEFFAPYVHTILTSSFNPKLQNGTDRFPWLVVFLGFVFTHRKRFSSAALCVDSKPQVRLNPALWVIPKVCGGSPCG